MHYIKVCLSYLYSVLVPIDDLSDILFIGSDSMFNKQVL